MHEKLFAELKATKIVLEVPSLRDQLPKTNSHGMNFNTFTRTLGELYRNTVDVLADKTGLCECGENMNNNGPKLTISLNKSKSRPRQRPSVSHTPHGHKGSEFSSS